MDVRFGEVIPAGIAMAVTTWENDGGLHRLCTGRVYLFIVHLKLIKIYSPEHMML